MFNYLRIIRRNKMATDIIIPNNNEKEFISFASVLGFDSLVFLYEKALFDKQKDVLLKYADRKKLRIKFGLLNNNYKGSGSEKKTTNYHYSPKNSRDCFEKAKSSTIYSLEFGRRKDFIHHRASGLNHVLCNLAKKNNISIGFSLSDIRKAKNRRHILIGRTIQNLYLCKKYKLKTVVGSFARQPYEMVAASDLKSLFKVLGRQ